MTVKTSSDERVSLIAVVTYNKHGFRMVRSQVDIAYYRYEVEVYPSGERNKGEFDYANYKWTAHFAARRIAREMRKELKVSAKRGSFTINAEKVTTTTFSV